MNVKKTFFPLINLDGGSGINGVALDTTTTVCTVPLSEYAFGRL